MTDRPVQPGDHVFLVDGSSFVFRAYFQSMRQDRKYNYRSDGLPTGAIRLFCTKLMQFMREGAAGSMPTHLGIIFDKTEDSLRREIYPAYKAHRPDPPSDLVPQFPLMRAAVRAFGLAPIEQGRYEADDLIATYARQATEAGADVLIISADKDMMQLIRPGVAMYDPATTGDYARAERKIGEEEVLEKFGVPPSRVTDVQALIGDSTDNVPGVPGIGVKTAAQLIGEYGDLETLLERAIEIKQPKRREALIEHAETARLSKRLVTLDEHVPVEVPLRALAMPEADPRTALAFMKAMEFTTMTRRLAEAAGIDLSSVEPTPDYAVGSVGGSFTQVRSDDAADGGPSPSPARNNGGKGEPEQPDGPATPLALAQKRRAELASMPCDRSAYVTITDLATLKAWVAEATEQGRLAIDTETTSIDPMRADIVGFSLATAPGKAAYVPVGHQAGEDNLLGGGLVPNQLPVRGALDILRPLYENPAVLKIGHDLKYELLLLARHGIRLAAFDDTMLMSYVLDAGKHGHSLDELAGKHLGQACIALADVTGSGRQRIAFEAVPIERAAPYAAEGADVALRLWQLFTARLVAERMATVYATLERPLPTVLAAMERRGIAVDRVMLARLAGDFAQVMARVEDEIAELGGEPFNIGSPKQLGDILFGKLGLPGGRKTKTGAWATGADVLEELAAEGHPLPAKVLEWRQVSKLKSTYADALGTYVHPETRRIHTTYQLAATATGRLSSAEPNLQNIPVRTEEGRKIRRAFVAEPGHKLVSADYSQIELRVLAHIAEIPQLRQAFADGIDIHAMTASEMFGVPVAGMDPQVRRRAKAINFGIIYGISAFGLANQLGIGRDEAGAYIKRYFERFPGIRDYMDSQRKFVRENGHVVTLFGRKCHYPQIDTRNPSERAFYERAAINAPIQGSAADIIRRAMARMDEALKKAGLSAKMLLQVHDELVFEVPDEEVERTMPIVAHVMEQAPLPAVALRVPLKVDARAATNWDEAH